MSDPSEAPKPVKLKLSSHLPKADESTPTKRPEEIQPNPAQAIAEATATTKQKSGNPFISTLIILILLLILIGGGVGFLYFLSGKGIIKHIKNEQTIKSTKPGSETEHVNADKPNRIGEALNILRIFSFNKEPDNTKQNVHLTTKPSYETTLHGQRETKADTTTRTSKNEKNGSGKSDPFPDQRQSE